MVDLSRLTFIDSVGVHALIETSKRCAGHVARLVIVPGPPAVQRVFDVCGVTAILPFATDDGVYRAARPRAVLGTQRIAICCTTCTPTPLGMAGNGVL